MDDVIYEVDDVEFLGKAYARGIQTPRYKIQHCINIMYSETSRQGGTWDQSFCH